MSGLGKRFVESGYKDPKPLIIVDNLPIIEHVVNLFDRKNDKYIFICNDLHLRETNMRQILSNIVPNSNIFEVPVEGRKGPVHAVSLIFDNIPNDEEIIVSYCDYGTQWNYKNFLKDNNILDNIADIGKITNEDIILEIGPGTGNLTSYILKKNPKKIKIPTYIKFLLLSIKKVSDDKMRNLSILLFINSELSK